MTDITPEPAIQTIQSQQLRTPPNVAPLRALWSPFDGIWGSLKGTWGVLVDLNDCTCNPGGMLVHIGGPIVPGPQNLQPYTAAAQVLLCDRREMAGDPQEAEYKGLRNYPCHLGMQYHGCMRNLGPQDW